ncbi:MAG: CDP-glycerol glycerophosphotransferase family protein, partial [Clostridia bacterium]|nr:CDP-glycerol glycerophosphotransferase family protein [Clostridia bacterium]
MDKNKVIFIESRLDKLSNSFQLLYQTLSEETDYNLKVHFLRKTFVSDKEYRNNCKELIRDMATAGYIFMDEATHILAKIKLRDESQLIQLWHGCGAFKKFGYSVTDGKFGASHRAKTRYPVHTNYSLVTVSSEEVIPHFEDAMNLRGKDTVRAVGISRTDIFYDRNFIENAYKKLYSVLPQSKNKKVILYAPTFRGNVESACAPDRLDTAKMSEALGDRYVLLIKQHPLVRSSP